MASSSTTLTPEVLLAADNETELVKASVGLAGSNQPTKTDVKDEEEAYKVPISQEAINQMLIGKVFATSKKKTIPNVVSIHFQVS